MGRILCSRIGMKSENVVRQKAYDFALRIVKLHRFLCSEKKEYALSKQIVRSGTSIGANIEEAIGGQSKRDFVSKMSIAYKEARETHYWLRLLRDADILEKQQAESITRDCDELLRLCGSILKTMRNKIPNS
jgi:four helix bundle protein